MRETALGRVIIYWCPIYTRWKMKFLVTCPFGKKKHFIRDTALIFLVINVYVSHDFWRKWWNVCNRKIAIENRFSKFLINSLHYIKGNGLTSTVNKIRKAGGAGHYISTLFIKIFEPFPWSFYFWQSAAVRFRPFSWIINCENETVQCGNRAFKRRMKNLGNLYGVCGLIICCSGLHVAPTLPAFPSHRQGFPRGYWSCRPREWESPKVRRFSSVLGNLRLAI